MKIQKLLFAALISTALLSASCQSTENTIVELDESLVKQGITLMTIRQAEAQANEAGKAVLQAGRKMVLEERAIIAGTCWTWANECYSRAGFQSDRYIAYRSSHGGPYVNTDEIRPGDWLYFVNHSYRNIGHSGIFVYWIDKSRKIGVVLSYPGLNKPEPGRYRKYLLNNVYYITRPGMKY